MDAPVPRRKAVRLLLENDHGLRRTLLGDLEFDYGPAFLRPFESGEFLVNGTPIAHLGNTSASRQVAPWISGAVPVSALKAFKYGANTLTIRVQKAATKRGQPCTVPNIQGNAGTLRYVGVLASIYLQFGAVLIALPSQAGKRIVQRKQGAGTSVLVNGTVNSQNNGPSASLSGRVEVSIAGAFNLTVALTSLQGSQFGPPFGTCTFDTVASQTPPSSMTCPYSDFRAGTIARLPVTGAIKLDNVFPSKIVRTARLHWIILPDQGNNPTDSIPDNQIAFVICGVDATNPVCA
jgi:hypothetical protein